MNVNVKNSLFGIISLCIGGALLFSTFGYKETSISGEYGKMFYPKIVLWLWVFLSILIIIQDALKARMHFSRVAWSKLAIAATIIGLACVFPVKVGFIPAGILFYIAYCYASGYRNMKVLIPLSVVYVVGIWALFTHVFLIQLP